MYAIRSYYDLLDWKSNHLGDRAQAYDSAALVRAREGSKPIGWTSALTPRIPSRS